MPKKKNKEKNPLFELRVMTIRLPEYQHQYMGQVAEVTGTSIADQIRQLIDIYIEV